MKAGERKRISRRISRRMSLVLRHQPQSVGLRLDDASWTSVESLITGLHINGKALEEVVETE